MAATASPVPRIDIAIPASPQNSSSLAIGRDRPVGSAQQVARNSKPYSPIFAACWISGHGVSSRASHPAAAGRTASAAKPCTPSRRSRCSPLRSSENSATVLVLRDVEEVGDVGRQTQVALGLQLAGHEHHHRVAVARYDLEEL